MDSSKPTEVKKFIKDLGEAISQDMTDIRETELDRAGGYEQVTLLGADGDTLRLDAFVDRLNRIILPVNDTRWEIRYVVVGAGTRPRKVVRTEVRHLGDRPVAKVLYLEAEETNV